MQAEAWIGARSSGRGAPVRADGSFSRHVVGPVELAASLLLIAGMAPPRAHLQALGARISLFVMRGVVNFHLWTPLAINPDSGGGSSVAACVNLIAAMLIHAIVRRKKTAGLFCRLGRALGSAF